MLPAKPEKDVAFAYSPYVADIVEPPESIKATGWLAQKPPRQYFNWLHSMYWKWQKYLDSRVKNVRVITAAGTYSPNLLSSERFHFDATNGNQSIDLSMIQATIDDNIEIEIKKIDSSANTVTILGTVEGEVNPVIEYQYTSRGVYAYNGLLYWYK